jgi:hypothetical protein
MGGFPDNIMKQDRCVRYSQIGGTCFHKTWRNTKTLFFKAGFFSHVLNAKSVSVPKRLILSGKCGDFNSFLTIKIEVTLW